jgi:hypothetical protein
MDACFELLLPQIARVDGLETRAVDVIACGGSRAYCPGTLHWGDFVELLQTPIPAHLGRFLPDNYITESWVALSIRGKGLDLLRDEVNGSEVDWKGKSLEQLLRILLSLYSRWVLVFELHCDQIDHVYELGIDGCLGLLRANLELNANVEGFIVIPPK